MSDEVLSRRILAYGDSFAIFGTRENGAREETFSVVAHGEVIGRFENWNSALAKFREVVTQRRLKASANEQL